MLNRGYFGVAIYNPRHEENVGSLWRTATCYDAAFLATVGRRYENRQASDTPNSRRHVPLHHYADMDDLIAHLPHDCFLIGVEMTPNAIPLDRYTHHERALYLLGAEDRGLPADVLRRCSTIIQIPTPRTFSLNVAVAGSITLAHRHMTRSSRRRGDLVPVDPPLTQRSPNP